MDHRQDRRQDLRRPRPQGGLGDHRGDRGDLHGQGNGDLRATGDPVTGRQQHRGECSKAHFRQDAANEGRILQPLAFVRIHRPPGLHRAVGQQRSQSPHHHALARRADHCRSHHRHGVAGPAALALRADVRAARCGRGAQDWPSRAQDHGERVPGRNADDGVAAGDGAGHSHRQGLYARELHAQSAKPARSRVFRGPRTSSRASAPAPARSWRVSAASPSRPSCFTAATP